MEPDLVHHITIKPILYGSIAAQRSDVPAVINNFTGLGYLFSQATSAAVLRFFVLPILRYFLSGNYIQTVFLNETDRLKLINYRIIDPDLTVIIPGDGVDLSRFSPRSVASPEDRLPVVIMASRLLWDKGVAEFRDAARLINDGAQRAEFWLVGEPDPGNPACVPEPILNTWKQEGDLNLLGHRDDMPDLLNQSDIAVLPSYHEGLPMFLLEAAGSGLALVGSDIPGNRQIIKEGINGKLVPLKDSQALGKAISELLDDDRSREKMGENSRTLVEERFSQKIILDHFWKLYQKMI
jgi:glycosyltransferase involved in cell wall biosynthesis